MLSKTRSGYGERGMKHSAHDKAQESDLMTQHPRVHCNQDPNN